MTIPWMDWIDRKTLHSFPMWSSLDGTVLHARLAKAQGESPQVSIQQVACDILQIPYLHFMSYLLPNLLEQIPVAPDFIV